MYLVQTLQGETQRIEERSLKKTLWKKIEREKEITILIKTKINPWKDRGCNGVVLRRND